MANPPPPYDNITGISRAVMKDNAQETLANYNGNARPGELVLDLTQDPPPLYVGNNAGALTLVTSGGGGLPLANGTSNFNIATSGGNATVTTNGTYTWTFDTAGNLTVPGNIVGTSTIDIDNRATGNSADIRLFSADDILIQARDRDAGSTSEGGDINIYAGDSAENSDTSAGDVQIFAGNGGAANVDYGGTGGFVTIRSGDGGPAIGNSGYSASSGGTLTIRAGDAGANGGNSDLGSGGGVVYIYGGTATGNNQAGGAIVLTSGTGGPNSAGGNIEVVVPGGDTGPGGTWTFNNAGNLTLPLSGNIVGVTANNNGHMQWVGNSSGDGAGYTTLRLVPDDTLVGNDQYLIIDPTAPGHIHIRAGGTQDASSADLFLGGENSYFKVNAGANNEVRISANSHAWVFGADSVLTVPGEGLIRSIGDVVTLQSYNVGTGNVQSVYLGSGGGLGFFDQDIGGNWLEIFKSGAEPQIRVPVGRGNLNVQTAEGINAYDWVFDNTGKLTMPGPAQLAVYANTTVRDSSITSPTPGMMIYVTGTGMQVRGATSWNTIAGTGT